MNDDLYSGVTPPIGNEDQPEDVQEEIAEEEALPKITQALYDQLHELIEDEIKAVSDVRTYLSANGFKDGNDILVEFRARELYISFLEGKLDSLLKDALRDG